MQRRFYYLLLLLPLIFNNGCATHALWTKADLDDWNEPAAKPDVRLFKTSAPEDFLVVYDEYSERHDSIRNRAYFLKQNQPRLLEKRAPDFVSTNRIAGLAVVPVFYSPAILTSHQMQSDHAVMATNNQSFTLYSGGKELDSFNLPVYNDGKGKIERTALTPLAVTADATIVGGVLGCCYLYAVGGGTGGDLFWWCNQ